MEILSKGNKAINQLRTFWTDHKFELSPGVDRSVNVEDEDQGKVCAVHLSHEPFLFKFVVVLFYCIHWQLLAKYEGTMTIVNPVLNRCVNLARDRNLEKQPFAFSWLPDMTRKGVDSI